MPNAMLLNVFRAGAVLVVVGVLGAAPPKPRPVITVETAPRLRATDEVVQDARRIVWGPKRGEVSFLPTARPVEVLDASTWKPVRQIGADKKILSFAIAPDGETVAWSGGGTRVEVHNLRTGAEGGIETGQDQPSVAFSPDGQLLATGGYGNRVDLWTIPAGRLVRTLPAGEEGGLRPVFSPDGKQLAVGNRNDATRLFEVATGKLLHVLNRPFTQELRFSPDGRTLAVGYVDGTVGLWDVAAGKLLRSAKSAAAEVYTLDWAPKGGVLATGGRHGVITLWDPNTLTVVKTLDAPDTVSQVRFTPDGTRLLSAGRAETPGAVGKVTVWSIPE